MSVNWGSAQKVVNIATSDHFVDYAEPKPLSVAGILVASILSGGLWLLAYWGFKAVMRAFGVNMDGAL